MNTDLLTFAVLAMKALEFTSAVLFWPVHMVNQCLAVQLHIVPEQPGALQLYDMCDVVSILFFY